MLNARSYDAALCALGIAASHGRNGRQLTLRIDNNGRARPGNEIIDEQAVALTRSRTRDDGNASVVIDVSVESEADPISVAPTASSTVALAMCDAIAVALMHRRGFTKEQFALFHPGGSLGRKLLLTVESVMHRDEEIPIVATDVTIRDVIDVISRKRLGATLVADGENCLVGILTDGDLRRTFERLANPLTETVGGHMISNPVSIGPNALAAEALRLMEEKQVTVLPVVDDQQKILGIVHMHDLIRAGLS